MIASVLYTAIVSTTSGTLNVRKAASKSTAILGRLNKGMTVEVIEEGEGWLRVQSGSLIGWCDASYLTKVATTEDVDVGNTKNYTIIITDSEGNTFRPVGAFTVKGI